MLKIDGPSGSVGCNDQTQMLYSGADAANVVTTHISRCAIVNIV